MESKRIAEPGAGGVEAEVFERVWNRVSPPGRESPVVVTPVGRQAKGGQCGAPPGEKTPAKTGANDLAAKEYEMIPARGGMALAACREEAMEPVCPEQVPAPPAEAPVFTGREEQGGEVICELAKLETGMSIRDVRGRARPVTERDHCYTDFPPKSAVPWLGSCGPAFDGLLQELIRKELSDWNYYRTLARKTGGTPAKTLSALAAEEWHCAKRLSAAYFLVSGIHYWPERTGKLNFTSYMGALRERFLEEQRDAETYGAAAAECRDECLCDLFEEIAGQNRDHAHRIRLLVEQM